MAVRILGVQKASPAQKAGLAAGMWLVAVDGHPIRDGLDYEFYTAGAVLQLTVRAGGEALSEPGGEAAGHNADGTMAKKRAAEAETCTPAAESPAAKTKEQNGKALQAAAAVAGKESTLTVVKDEYQPLGCEFASYLIDAQHHCKNKCSFCFIDQLPPGLRAPLYFKDDDERLGFLFGNYITLTNLYDAEVDRIIEMRISPVNISVHTANPTLRAEMMGNRFAGEVLRYIPRLAAAGVAMNIQLVLVPGVNDGPELRRSIEWLAQYRPAVQSIAAVPVGLTKYREGLPEMQPYTAKTARQQLSILLEYGDEFFAQDGVRLVYPSDEWFLLAGRPVPEADFYDGYLQLENGVGMWRLLQDEFTEALEGEWDLPGEGVADIAVGALVAPLFRRLAEQLQAAYPGVQLVVHEIRNDFFGHGVTVTGLLTGGDIIAQLRHEMVGETLLLPACTLRAEGDVLLDDVAPQDIAKALGVRVQVVPSGGEFLLEAIFAQCGGQNTLPGGAVPDGLSDTGRLEEGR